MLQLKMICVGKVKEKYLQEGIREYAKRLTPLLRLQLIEVQDEACPEGVSAAEAEKLKEKEAERILRMVREPEYVMLLASEGKSLDSPGFAAYLEQLAGRGRSSVVLIIGGSLGVSCSVKERADFLWSFSALTFPHQLMRLLVVEQVYRALKIQRGEPYHK
ncbi:MAG: 23S rRNA (pseudouridine(1915)-N(3))-methyltransferase RlmH [Peptococcaceae bacterium]|jgi:23S rRNA (pseudouridine1915-N3)-methyltransferase|nr:23S rRNA (pseudouridine(1915)-N(3))-methyltransferase RlmH [Peptococcaceae bacterium]